MKLVFYSGGTGEQNRTLDGECLNLSGKKFPKITYIPACSFDSEIDFKDFVHQFAEFDITQFIYFPIDIPFDQIIMKEAFKSDIIHLSGGNTFYFLNSLRKSGLIAELIDFVQRGGVLTGLSAGAILMTPTITTASFPKFDCDVNHDGVKNFKALNLVQFEIFPHYKKSNRYEKELIAYSKKSKFPIYALPDGSGIIAESESLRFFGKTYLFHQGKKCTLLK